MSASIQMGTMAFPTPSRAISTTALRGNPRRKTRHAHPKSATNKGQYAGMRSTAMDTASSMTIPARMNDDSATEKTLRTLCDLPDAPTYPESGALTWPSGRTAMRLYHISWDLRTGICEAADDSEAAFARTGSKPTDKRRLSNRGQRGRPNQGMERGRPNRCDAALIRRAGHEKRIAGREELRTASGNTCSEP